MTERRIPNFLPRIKIGWYSLAWAGDSANLPGAVHFEHYKKPEFLFSLAGRNDIW
jgi:hypothetical protein